MLVIPEGSDKALRAEFISRAVLRSDLTPIPETLELEVRDCTDTAPLREGATVTAGRDSSKFLIVKCTPGGDSGRVQGDRPVAMRKIVAILASCAPIAQPMQRSIIRYGASLGELYRACGAQVQIEQDFAVSVFACYRGMTPSFEIAKALQEEAGALVLRKGVVAFKRLAQMVEEKPAGTMREDSAEGIESNFLERHTVPFAFSTAPDNSIIVGRSDTGRGVVYRPRATESIMNNMKTALITRRKVDSDFAPHILAGMRYDVAGRPLVVITAAHSYEGGSEGGHGTQKTKLWLGELVR